MKQFLAGLVAATCLSAPGYATYSIIACEAETRRCGVAVATHNLAVGNSVPFARAGVGAGVSQFETNPRHGPLILQALGEGGTAHQALSQALATDAQFGDGLDAAFRQLGVVSFEGNAAAFTGDEANSWAGHRAEGFVSVQGNGLVSEGVLIAMWDRFHASEGSLEERLMLALEAGHDAGGQPIGVTSAALLVATPEGWPVDVDLRVDFAPETAITQLREMYDAGVARQLLFRARRLVAADQHEQADALIEAALERAPGWDRIWLTAARLAEDMGQNERAQIRFCTFARLNPQWAEMMSGDLSIGPCGEGATAGE